MMASDSLAQIAAELYVVPPAGFIAARNTRATEAADRELATQIRALRKPSVAAWVVNVLAAERAVDLEQALQLAGLLRDAQDDLDATSLADLGRRRRALTDRLAHDAVALARARGTQVSAATAQAVADTLRAAFFDPDAAAAVASGRLVRELPPAGGPDLAEAVGGPPAQPSPPAPADEVAARREPREAERVVRTAEQAVATARREFDRTDRDVVDTAARIDQLARREHELQDELVHLRERLDQARSQHAQLDEQRTAAGEALATAERELTRARDAGAAAGIAP